MEFAISNTVPLPYHLPGEMATDELLKYEKKCLKTIQNRCLLAQMAKKPFQAILLELVLASNGAILTDHALLCLGNLCKHHGISIVVDEIMTGGRAGSLLHTQTKPAEFVDEVSHITLGKWVRLGLCLISKKHRDMNRDLQANIPYRGPSFCREDCGGAILVWHHVASNQKNVQKRREALIKKLQAKDKSTAWWGVGLMVFGNVLRTDGHDMSNRFLPMLEDTQFTLPKLFRNNPTFCKKSANTAIVDGVKSWIHHYPSHIPQNQVILISKMSQHSNRYFNTQWVKDHVLNEEGRDNLHTTSVVLNIAKDAKIIEKVTKGPKRLKGWVI